LGAFQFYRNLFTEVAGFQGEEISRYFEDLNAE
jgi:hypothetical protein